MLRNTRLTRKTPIRRRSKKRAAQHAVYAKLRPTYLTENPVCQVWLKENGWERAEAPAWYRRIGTTDGSEINATCLLQNFDAPRSTEIHHANKRHGTRLNETADWMAVCRANHDRIENNKAWARREGFLRNF